MVVPGFGVSARPNIVSANVVAAEEVAGDGAEDREQQSESQARGVYNHMVPAQLLAY
jgi:hypothetical protein